MDQAGKPRAPRKGDSLRAQVGPFAMVPVWLLDRCRDSKAIHLYALLGKHANRERRAWPKSEQLAEAMGLSLRSIERLIAKLRQLGALQTERRRRADGAVIGLDFLLVQIDPQPVDAKQQPDTSVGLVDSALPDTPDGLSSEQPATGDGLLPTTHSDTAGGLSVVHSDTPVAAIPTPVSESIKEEPDPFNQIQERTEERESAAPPPSPPALPKDLQAAWNELTTAPLPRCVLLTATRIRHAHARLKERSLEAWRDVFRRIEQSTFCRGQNDRGWVADFSWITESPDNAVKVLEGKYDDRPRPMPMRPLTASEIAEARRMRREVYGGCPHSPRCETSQACEGELIRQWRRDRGEAA